MIGQEQTLDTQGRARALLARFFDWNRRVCAGVEERLPAAFTRHLHTSYKYLVADRLNAAQGLLVVDVGGGKECPYLQYVSDPDRHSVVSLDIDEGELRQNRSCRLRVVADASRAALPIEAGCVDLITSRSVIEHLPNNEAFLKHCHGALRPNGCIIHTFPCRFSPFAIINRLLPDAVARALLYYFHPQWRDECGFKVYYDQCSYREMSGVLDRVGFDVTACEMRYYEAIYYDFFVPLYLVMLAYDLLAYWSGIKSLACQMLFVAQKRSST